MKTLLIAALGLFTLGSLPACAQEKPAKEGGGTGHSHFVKIPPTIEGIWTEIGSQQKKLAEVVAKGQFGEAHDHGYAIRDLVKALPDKVPAENKTKAATASAEITKLAAALDKSSAAKAKKATDDNVQKLATAITALQESLKVK